MSESTVAERRALLTRYVAEKLNGELLGEIVDVSGHSGEVLKFSVARADSAVSYVIRIAPPGVEYKGNLDLMRQVPLLRCLVEQGYTVPDIIDADDSGSWFGVPYLLMECIEGKPVTMGPDADLSWLLAGGRQLACELAGKNLGTLHRCSDEALLQAHWDRYNLVEEELQRWEAVFARSPEAQWLIASKHIASALRASAPDAPSLGIVHGDFQTNNILYQYDEAGLRVMGVVDWEVASLGMQGLDISWLLMMNDGMSWDPIECRGGVQLQPVLAAYESSLGHEVKDLPWFFALSCFRIAAIAAYNIRLHRKGHKHDPAWERAASSVPILLARAEQCLHCTNSQSLLQAL